MEGKTLKKVVRFLPAISWMLIMFYFSSHQTSDLGKTATTSFFIYKSFHLIEYALLTILLFFALKEIKYSIMIAYLYGMSDELHQTITSGRTGCIRDTLIDLLGIIIGAILLTQLKRIKLFSRFLF